MKVGFVVYSMAAGGAERTVSVLANGLVCEGDEVHIITLAEDSDESFFVLDPRVKLRSFGVSSSDGVLSYRYRFGKYRKVAQWLSKQKFDAVVSFTTEVNVLILLAAAARPRSIIVSERSDPAAIPRARAWRMLRWLTYKGLARGVVVQTNYAKRYLEKHGVRNAKVLSNPVTVASRNTPAGGHGQRAVPRVVSAGRLTPEKRYEVLLRAVKELENRKVFPGLPDFECIVYGEGCCRDMLEKLAVQLNLTKQVEFKGFKADPWHDVRPGDIFVQSSDFEGFPNALFEAMIVGCAVITTQYSPAVEEVIDDGWNGIVIPRRDVAGLAREIAGLLRDETRRTKLGRNAREAMARMNPAEIVPKWRSFLTDV